MFACIKFAAAVADALNASTAAASTALTVLEYLRALLGHLVGLQIENDFKSYIKIFRKYNPRLVSRKGAHTSKVLGNEQALQSWTRACWIASSASSFPA